MNVRLLQLIFDHADGHALHIRQDGDSDAPPDTCAYALSTTPRRVTIVGYFKFGLAAGEPRPDTVAIRAVPADGVPVVLGNIEPATVDVPSDGQASGPVMLTVSTAGMREKGVGRYDIGWHWQYRITGSPEWISFETSSHILYVTLAPPTNPWTQNVDVVSKRLWPWTRALDWACDWASRVRLTTELDDAQRKLASAIEVGVHGLGEQQILSYDGGSSGNFIVGTTTGVFKLTRFIRVLEGQAGERPVDVYCSETAAAVAVFANCLGAKLKLLKIRRRDNAMMDLNRIIAIGNRRSSSPSFRFHEVAVRPGTSGKQVFDACLQPDWDTNLRNRVHDFRLSQGRRLGALRLNRLGTTYLHRLLEPDEPLWEQVEMVDTPLPALDARPAGLEPVIGEDDRLKILFRNQIDLFSPAGPPAAPLSPVIRAFKFPGFRMYKQVDSMSHLEELRPLVADYAGFAYTAFRKDQQGPDFDPDRRFRISVAWSNTVANAREALAWLMTRTEKPLARLKRADKKPLGDVAFATPGQRTVFILRRNVFARLVSTGKKVVPMRPIAERLDREFLKLKKAGQLGSITPQP